MTILPDPPQGLTVTSKTATSVSLSWEAVEFSGGIDKYEVYRDGQAIGTRKGLTYADNDLSPSETYEYQVAAIALSGAVSSLSEPLIVTTDSEPDPPEDPDEDDPSEGDE
ncbi:fibronectin type III domain-containing protein [Halalkalibacter oceani]|uniref:fibronectin type III domain-containing protein n=1 Tax=Halalkalibacter oceani TaxID=1653776 RepID=UPI00339AC66D